ncbi:juvenile hormone acid O-methyltransferase-like [Amblyomma americanum]
MSSPQANMQPSAARALIEKHEAEVFEARSELYTAANAAILNAFHSAFMICDDQEQQQFIDVGCGIGDLAFKHLLPRCSPCRRLVAADLSDNLIKLAAKKYPHPKIEYLQLDIVGDVEGFVAEQGQFQRVYSFATLHWVKDKRLAMLNFEKLLTPGGELFLVMLGGSLIHDLYKAMMNSPRWIKYNKVLQECMPVISAAQDKESLRKYAADLIKLTKLIPLTCEVVSYPSTNKTKDEMIRDFLLFHHIKPLLNDEEKEELRKFITEFTEKIWVSSQKGKILDRKMIVIHAQKPLN